MDEKDLEMEQHLERVGGAFRAANVPDAEFASRIKAALRAEAKREVRHSPMRRTRVLAVAAAAALVLILAGYAAVLKSGDREKVQLLFSQGSFTASATEFTNDDLIESGADARAILLSDDGRVRLFLASSSALRIDGEDRVSLERGELWVDIEPKSGFYMVRTPNATVTVQGTRFGVRVGEDGTKVAIESGEVSIRAGDRTAALRPGNSARVPTASGATELETGSAELPGWVTTLEQDFLRSAAARRYPSGWTGRTP